MSVNGILKNPVTRLVVVTIELTNGTSFQIVHNLSEAKGDALIAKWMRKTKRPTALNLIHYIRDRADCICVTKEQYDEVTAGKVVHATKEEYEAENN